MKRILLLGGTGQVGYELVRSLSPLGEIMAPGRDAFDLQAGEQAIRESVRRLRPDIVINAAAYTAVDKAETETDLAWQINAAAPGEIAAACESLGIPLIHFSTDYIFDGTASRPWVETDTNNPLNAYGRSKLAGEEAIRQSGVMHCILRTSWVYGNRGKNFLNTMRKLAQDKHEVQIVDDQIGAPTWSRHIAEAVTAMLAMSFRQEQSFWGDISGTYHLSNGGATSWCGFASAIFDELGKTGHSVPAVSPIRTDAYPTPAKRPLYSVLDNTFIEQRLGIRLPDWRQAMSQVMQDFER